MIGNEMNNDDGATTLANYSGRADCMYREREKERETLNVIGSRSMQSNRKKNSEIT